MFLSMVILLILLIFVMLFCIRLVNKRVVRNRKSVVHLIWTAVFTTVCYTTFILIPSDRPFPAYFAAGLYFLATDWLVVYLMLFTSAYTHVYPISKTPRRIICFLAGLDSVSFIVNAFTRHMFELEIRHSGRLNLNYWHVQLKPPHIAHRIFVYLLVLYSLVIFTYQLIRVPDIYKRKYGSMLIQIAAVVGLNIFCAAMNARFDYSVILYASLAISICYLALFASPRKLLERIHSTIVEDSVIGLFAYDNEGNCIGANRAAKELFAVSGDVYAAAEQYLAD